MRQRRFEGRGVDFFFFVVLDLTKFATIVSYTLSHAVRDRQSDPEKSGKIRSSVQ